MNPRRYLKLFGTVARALRDARGWVPSLALFDEFGPRVYPIVRRLERDGMLDRKEETGGPERGNRPRALYHWRPLPPATERPD
jgi:hypothetical protein